MTQENGSKNYVYKKKLNLIITPWKKKYIIEDFQKRIGNALVRKITENDWWKKKEENKMWTNYLHGHTDSKQTHTHTHTHTHTRNKRNYKTDTKRNTRCPEERKKTIKKMYRNTKTFTYNNSLWGKNHQVWGKKKCLLGKYEKTYL